MAKIDVNMPWPILNWPVDWTVYVWGKISTGSEVVESHVRLKRWNNNDIQKHIQVEVDKALSLWILGIIFIFYILFSWNLFEMIVYCSNLPRNMYNCPGKCKCLINMILWLCCILMLVIAKILYCKTEPSICHNNSKIAQIALSVRTLWNIF